MFASCWRFSSENIVAWCGALCAVFRIIVLIFFCCLRYSFICSNCLSIYVHFFCYIIENSVSSRFVSFGYCVVYLVYVICWLVGDCLCVKIECIRAWPTNFRNEIIIIVIYIWPVVTNESELIELIKQTWKKRNL